MRLDRINGIKVLTESFDTTRPGYQRRDKGMSQTSAIRLVRPLIRESRREFFDQLCNAIFPILRQRADSRCPITYSELGAQVGVYHRDQRLHSALGSIWTWCSDHEYPHLNALVIRKSGPRRGMPGTGYRPEGRAISRETWVSLRQQIYEYDWDKVRPPKSWPTGLCGN